MGLFSLLVVATLAYSGLAFFLTLVAQMVPSPTLILIFAASLILAAVAGWGLYAFKKWKLSLLFLFMPVIELGVMAFLPSS